MAPSVRIRRAVAHLHFELPIPLTIPLSSGLTSRERSACMTSTARRVAAGTRGDHRDSEQQQAERRQAWRRHLYFQEKSAANRSSTYRKCADYEPPATAITRLLHTPFQQICGRDPAPPDVPNSRVRALTENASTPATPTTATRPAPHREHAKHKRSQSSGVSTSARTSSERGGSFTG